MKTLKNITRLLLVGLLFFPFSIVLLFAFLTDSLVMTLDVWKKNKL